MHQVQEHIRVLPQHQQGEHQQVQEQFQAGSQAQYRLCVRHGQEHKVEKGNIRRNLRREALHVHHPEPQQK